MSNFQINDVIQICNITVVSPNLTVATSSYYGYGKITNTDDTIITVDWDFKKVYNDILNIDNIDNIKFGFPNNVVILKQVNDNNWVDKDGNNFDNKGVKQ
tara:strand:+ start:37 stop:336 length:300 start_codon:yes stop_codon:yes gene_type:complete